MYPVEKYCVQICVTLEPFNTVLCLNKPWLKNFILGKLKYSVHLLVKEEACGIVKGKSHSELEEIITKVACKVDVRFKVSCRNKG